MDARSANACTSGTSSASSRAPPAAPNTFSSPITWVRSRSGNAWTERNPASVACGANRGQRHRKYGAGLSVDGIPGRATHKAVVNLLGETDGVVGPRRYRSLALD